MSDRQNTNAPTRQPLALGGQLHALRPQTFEDVQRMAKLAVMAGLTPKGRGGDAVPEDVMVAQATMAILQGLECDIPPIQALQGIAIINGRALIYGDLLTALLWSKGFKVEKHIEGTGDNRVAVAKITRPDGRTIEKRFSVADAKQARLWDQRDKVEKRGKNGPYMAANDSPWFRFPERMLEWRAFGWAVKDGASDATHGLLTYEEEAPEANRIVDITPPDHQSKRGKDLDIPDEIPEAQVVDVQAPEPESQEQIVFPSPVEYLRKLQDERDLCNSEAELEELRAANKEIIAGLKPRDRKKADAILKLE